MKKHISGITKGAPEVFKADTGLNLVVLTQFIIDVLTALDGLFARKAEQQT